MNMLNCDICGTSYPDTEEKCPTCGYSRAFDEETMNQPTVRAPHQRVRGGRYSKRNVLKRQKMQENANKGQHGEDAVTQKIEEPVQAPVTESGPVVQEIREEVVPVAEEIREEAAPVAEEIPEEAAPVVEEVPEEAAPVVEEAPEEAAPVAEEAPEEAAPVAEEAPEEPAPVAEEPKAEKPAKVKKEKPSKEVRRRRRRLNAALFLSVLVFLGSLAYLATYFGLLDVDMLPEWVPAEITEFLDDHFESVVPSTEEPQAGSTGLHYTQLYFDDAAGV